MLLVQKTEADRCCVGILLSNSEIREKYSPSQENEIGDNVVRTLAIFVSDNVH